MSSSDPAIARPAECPLPFLTGIACLYTSFGITFGMLQAGLPPILRAQGVDIGSLGWLTAILLPFGLTFLWASWLDRIEFGRSAPRIIWIVVTQMLTIIFLVSLAYAGSNSLAVVFGLSLAIAFCAATMDIALDALTSRAVEPAYRPIAGGIKVGSLAIGSIFGGGLFVVYFQQVGWTAVFLTLACVTFLATLPILGQAGRDMHVPVAARGKARASLVRVLREPAHRRNLAVLASISLPVVLLFGLNRVMLIDIGLSLEEIGAIVGTVSPIASLLATGLSVVLMRHYGATTSIIASAGICILAAGSILAGLNIDGQTALVIGGVIGATAGSSGIYVATCSLILGWANSDQPATDYAALYGISRLLSLIALMVMAQAVHMIGWSGFYMVASVALVAGIAIAIRVMPGPSRRTSSRLASQDTP